jgi:hypothetical protein
MVMSLMTRRDIDLSVVVTSKMAYANGRRYKSRVSALSEAKAIPAPYGSSRP